jgi:hypothetical protein
MLQLTGMTDHEALRAATIMVADGLGMRKDFGSLEVGKVADLLVLDRNPLADIRNTTAIQCVMQDTSPTSRRTPALQIPRVRPAAEDRLDRYDPREMRRGWPVFRTPPSEWPVVAVVAKFRLDSDASIQSPDPRSVMTASDRLVSASPR